MTTKIISIMLLLMVFTTHFCFLSAQTGNITWTLSRETNPTQDQSDAYKRITTAMDSAVGYYNKYTILTKHLNVSYNTGVKTADASFNGTLRFGSSRSYMVVHTAMHEISHAVGIGTTSEYTNLIKNKIYTGEKATAILREITGDQTAVLHGDNQHIWPYGLNYESEITGVKDLINHCYIVNAVYQDLFHESEYGIFHLKSKYTGKVAYAQQNELLLGDRLESNSIVKLVTLNDTNTFRLEFGSKVLDIPNESTSTGVQAKLWEWNSGANQRAYFEFQSQNTLRIRMVHSGLYLRADGDKIIQDRASNATESQYWELTLLNTTSAVENNTDYTNYFNTHVNLKITNNLIRLQLPDIINNPATITILDLQGKIHQSTTLLNGRSLSINSLSSGIYIACVKMGNQVSTLDFVIK